MAKYEPTGAGRWMVLAVIAALWQTAPLCPVAIAQEGMSAMQLKAEIKGLVQDIVAIPQLDAAAIGEYFHARPARMDESGNPYVAIFTAIVPEPSPVEKLELRVPSQKNPAGNTLLILTIRSKNSVSIHDIRNAYGPPVQVDLPRAAAPFGTPTYESYQYEWGKLTFGYLPAQQDRVRQIIFDRN